MRETLQQRTNKRQGGLAPGDVVGGAFLILRALATGGAGSVWLAANASAGAEGSPRWVIKEVRQGSAFGDVLARDMLRAEADVLRRLEHPNLMRIVDVITENGHLYMVSELIEGVTLDRVTEAHGALDEQRVRDIGLQLCDVLGYLHSRRQCVIYRDLKPANIMLCRDGSVKLIDFGTARMAGRNTQTDRTAMGTKGYAAPEQYGETERLRETADVYALGKTLTALATGGKTNTRRMRNGVLKDILRRCTMSGKSRRYQSVAEVAWALRNGTQRTTARRARADIARSKKSARVNGVLRIGKQMPAKHALSYSDIEVPLDDPSADVRLALDNDLVSVTSMDAFFIECDVMVTLREQYMFRA